MSRFRNVRNERGSARKHMYRMLVCVVLLGCQSQPKFVHDTPPIGGAPSVRQIEIPCLDEAPASDVAEMSEPLSLSNQEGAESWSLTLEQVVEIALANSDVIRDIGGRIVDSPQTARSVYDVALQEIDPNFGVEGALSAFDAQVATQLLFNRDEQTLNNLFFGGGTSSLVGNTADFNTELSKRGATGSRYALRNITFYNRNNSPANRFPSAYFTAMEAEMRHPLLRGSGIEFNRIAGPNATPGNYNGVLLARIRTDIALADFEGGVVTLVRDVEAAYWQLYFAYRTLDARKAAYDAALASWRTVQEQLEAGAADGETEALTRANYYLAKTALQNALSGGADQPGLVGVYRAERTLRNLMGIPANDGRLIRPADEPLPAKRVFDWQDSMDTALRQRVELRRQRWVIKQRENELVAAKNFLLSQLDFVGLYRWRGFGDDLFGNNNSLNGSATEDLFGGDLQGWQLGLQYSTNLGKRREHAAVRSAELRLARERSILRNQELTISSALSSQYAELERTYHVTMANFNRSIAERQRLEAAMAKYQAGEELLEFVLQAQQNTANADTEYYRTLVEYNLAVADFHRTRGTYLEYQGVQLSEGAWSADAYRSYAKEFRRFKPRLNYCMMTPARVSAGTHPQVVMLDPTLRMTDIPDDVDGSQLPTSPTSSDAPLPAAEQTQRFDNPLPPDPMSVNRRTDHGASDDREPSIARRMSTVLERATMIRLSE